jgi:hypothetical protein
MPTILTPQLIQETAAAVSADVMNREDMIAIDRREMPLLDFMWGKRKTDAGSAGGVTKVNLKTAGDERLQYWSGRDVLGFSENFIDLVLQFGFKNVHKGLELLHSDLLDQGYSINYNTPRDAKFAKKVPADEVNRLADIFTEKVETHTDNMKVLLDRELHATDNPDGLAGLDALISVDPTSGTIGGKSRAGNPLLQHTVRTGLTTTTGGTLWLGMTQGIRAANLNGRGRAARVDKIFCGSDFLDGFATWVQNNNFQVNTQASKAGRIDPAIGDSERFFAGIPLMYDPTLDLLSSAGYPDNGVPWSKRAYGLASKAIQVRCPTGMDMQNSFPDDPSDQRFTRMSTDIRLAIVNMIPNAHVLFSIN